jgi:hypothetical protein
MNSGLELFGVEKFPNVLENHSLHTLLAGLFPFSPPN